VVNVDFLSVHVEDLGSGILLLDVVVATEFHDAVQGHEELVLGHSQDDSEVVRVVKALARETEHGLLRN